MHRGHPIVCDDGEVWHYLDGVTVSAEPDRPCAHCGLSNTPEGHDGCLGILRGGVTNACCGHGNDQEAYIQFVDGQRLAGTVALDIARVLTP
jgi:hypothetical protein